MGNLVANFPMQRLNHGFGSNPLNLCNLRNLWIFDPRQFFERDFGARFYLLTS
jgi:hypothetical protein